ncbi:unnamed protein product [Brassica oleracea var. botrytis]|uniref:F-box domain-containing protein n=2 Tax=Brassica TaxID=3705 RepID=A0A0D3E4Q1_BRAOL|nr:unnamed protein product [Brassica napus]CDY68243.1 BnaCnng58210D [Brassica napus]
MEHRKKAKTDYLPTDLTTETLLRLPEKSVARFSCVSKLWSSITTDPSFISLFETRSPRQRLLLCFQKYAKLFVSSIPQHTQNSNRSYSSSLSFDHHHIRSVQESRRTVKINHKHRSSWDTVGRCIDGVIYYLTFPCQNLDYIVMSFDVRSEKFDMIKLPSGFDGNFLVTYKGSWRRFEFKGMAGDKSVSNGRVRDSLHVTFKLRPNLKMQRSSGRSDTYANTATNGAESTTMSAHADEQNKVEIET